MNPEKFPGEREIEEKIPESKAEQKEKEPVVLGEALFIRHGEVGGYPYNQETGANEGDLTEDARRKTEKMGEELSELYNPKETDFIIWHSPRYRADQTAEILLDKLSKNGFDVFLNKALRMEQLGEALTHEDEEVLKSAGPKRWYAENAPEKTKRALKENEEKFLFLARSMLEKVNRLREKGNEHFDKNKKTILLGVGHNLTLNNLVSELFPDRSITNDPIKNLEKVKMKFLEGGKISVELEDGRTATLSQDKDKKEK